MRESYEGKICGGGAGVNGMTTEPSAEGKGMMENAGK